MLILDYDRVSFEISQVLSHFSSDEKNLSTKGLKVQHHGVHPGVEKVILSNDIITLEFWLAILGLKNEAMEYTYPSLLVAKYMMNCYLAAQRGEEFELPIRVTSDMLEDLKTSPYVSTLEDLVWTPMSPPSVEEEPEKPELTPAV
jgi:hypothetical protein